MSLACDARHQPNPGGNRTHDARQDRNQSRSEEFQTSRGKREADLSRYRFAACRCVPPVEYFNATFSASKIRSKIVPHTARTFKTANLCAHYTDLKRRIYMATNKNGLRNGTDLRNNLGPSSAA